MSFRRTCRDLNAEGPAPPPARGQDRGHGADRGPARSCCAARAREHGASAVEHVVLVEELDALIARGDRAFDLEAAWRVVEPTDLLTLIYTSGTTGPPKGVQTTHANMLAELRGVHAAVPISSGG